jgi:hypothetical protein
MRVFKLEKEQLYYDGSGQVTSQADESASSMQEPFQLTDEMRKNMSANPFTID